MRQYVPKNSLHVLRIPKQLCEYAVTQNLVKPMQLFLYLKANSSGITPISEADKQRIANELNISARTVRAYLDKLIEINWVGYNKKSRMYFIRGFAAIMKQHNFTSRTTAELDTRQIGKAKEFIAASVIAYLVNAQIKRRNKAHAAERDILPRSLQAQTPPAFFPVSNKSVSKCLGISMSKANRLKDIANNYDHIEINPSFINTGIDYQYIKQFRKANPDLPLKTVDGKIVIIKSDVVMHSITFKGGRKRDSLKKTAKTGNI